jgi:hypothetical protein
MIFVFGSNLAGRHGKGAAKHALEHYGAIYRRGKGMQGNSYAIPTKDHSIKTLPLKDIEIHVNTFIKFTLNNPNLKFKVTQIGCGLAGYTKEQIAPLFKNASFNCYFDKEWKNILNDTYNYWN